MPPRILRLHRTDKPHQHLLIHIVQSGSNPLDLKFIGTEHEHLYHLTIKESNIKALQATSFSGDLNEWKDILKFAFLQEHRPPNPGGLLLEGVEIVAAISGEVLTVTLRKNIEGITQRLGSVKLEQDDEREEVGAFEWVDTAVACSDELRSRLETLQASVSGQQAEVAKLTKQLDDLVRAKQEHEDELLKKFAALLNAKKLKIRDQQRLLAGAKVDPETARDVNEARSDHVRDAGASRKGKRRAAEADEDVMHDYEEQEADERRQEETDEATEDEDEESPPTPGASNANGATAMDIEEPGEPPPRRELPFTRRNDPAARPPEPSADEDDDETDDEL